VINVAVAGWEIVVELITGHAHKRGGKEGLDVEGRETLRIVVGVLTLEVTTRIDGLEEGLSVGVLAVGRAAEFPPVTVDNNTGVSGNRVVSVEDEGLKDLHVLNDESTILKDGFGISAKQGLKLCCTVQRK